MPSIDHSWIDRCLGAGKTVPWTGELLVAASAAARAALDGASTVPVVEPSWASPERRAEVTWAVASAALAARRDIAPALIDRAFAEATAVTVDWKRDRLLGWGAQELAGIDPDRAAAWSAAIKERDYRPELAAQEVVRLAHQHGRASVAALPPMWGLRTDVEFWPGYPRWLGSAAMTAAVALAAPIEDGRALVEEAERLTAEVSVEWRQNREYRALALAWARAGDLDRAFAAAARMPGTERSAAIATLLDDFGDAPGVEVARLQALARSALAATRSEPFILGGTDRAEMLDVIAQVVEGTVAAALVRRHLARGDLRAAAAAVDAIPEELSVHHEAALQLACARLSNGELALDDVVAGLPASYAANLAEAAAQMRSMEVVRAVLGASNHRVRMTANVGQRLLHEGRLDAALALAGGFPDPDHDLAVKVHAELVVMLARGGRSGDAIAALRAIPAQELKTTEELVTASGYRAVVALVARGDLAGARALDAELAPRLARIATMEEDS